MIEEFVTKYKNSKAVIQQIKAGEWEFEWNGLSGTVYTATRKGCELWVGNGSSFLDVSSSSGVSQNSFGFIFRHWVWFAAARKARKEAIRKFKRQHTIRFYE